MAALRIRSDFACTCQDAKHVKGCRTKFSDLYSPPQDRAATVRPQMRVICVYLDMPCGGQHMQTGCYFLRFFEIDASAALKAGSLQLLLLRHKFVTSSSACCNPTLRRVAQHFK